jgi:hypothetical protein
MSRPIDLGETDRRPYIRMAARLRKQILAGEIAPGAARPVAEIQLTVVRLDLPRRITPQLSDRQSRCCARGDVGGREGWCGARRRRPPSAGA